MTFLIRGLAAVAVLAVLALAAYGGRALLIDDSPSSTASTESVLQASSESAPASSSQDSWQDEMVKVCTEHMAEMQPVMDGGGDGGMMDGGMMGR